MTVSTRRAGDRVEVRVSDNGPGVPAEARSRVFEPFFSTKPTGEGTGLGLSIVRAVARRHGGRAYAESRGADRGSTFTLELPLKSS